MQQDTIEVGEFTLQTFPNDTLDILICVDELEKKSGTGDFIIMDLQKPETKSAEAVTINTVNVESKAEIKNGNIMEAVYFAAERLAEKIMEESAMASFKDENEHQESLEILKQRILYSFAMGGPAPDEPEWLLERRIEL